MGGGHIGGGSIGGSHHSGGGSFGGSHHHSGGGIYIGGGGFGLGYGSGYYGGFGGYPYRSYGYGGLGYSSGYGYSNYGGYYPSYGYSSSVYVTPQYVSPAPRVIYQSPSVIYQSPTVQSSSVVVQSSRIGTPTQDVGQRTSLPGVSFGARAHLNVLADAVAERTTLLLGDLNSFYQGNPQYQEVYKDTELLAASAKQIPSLASDSQNLLAAVQDLNTLFNALNPAIERWTPNGGGSAASQLSGVKSALQLLTIDAGYDPSHPVSRPVQAPVAPAASPTPATSRAPEPTPADAVPAP